MDFAGARHCQHARDSLRLDLVISASIECVFKQRWVHQALTSLSFIVLSEVKPRRRDADIGAERER